MAKKDNPIKKNKNSDEIKPKVEKAIKPPPGDTRKKTKKNTSPETIIINDNPILNKAKEETKEVKETKEKKEEIKKEKKEIKKATKEVKKVTKKEVKEVTKEEVKEAIKEEVKEEVKEEIKEEVKEEQEIVPVLVIIEELEKEELEQLPEQSVQKKRGRRPKQKTEEELLKASQPQNITKKKGKNPKESYGLNDEFEEDDPFFNQQEPEKECLETPIMRLNVTSNDIKKIKDPNFNIGEGDNELNIPSAFNCNDGFSYYQSNSLIQGKENSNIQNITEEDIQKIRSIREKELENVDSNNESKLLNQYIEHNKKETWPEKSVYDCMWCRFPFDNTPWAVPYRVNYNGKFEVFGNFCSPNCVAAYIFDSFDDDEMWDRYALLNQLYQLVYNSPGAVVKAAPDVLFLKKLGGILSIEEYREISGNQNKNYYLKMPPMISIIPSVEELQQTSLFNENNNREHLNKELMMKANDELRIRRSKPIYDDTNTLDNYFHIPKN